MWLQRSAQSCGFSAPRFMWLQLWRWRLFKKDNIQSCRACELCRMWLKLPCRDFFKGLPTWQPVCLCRNDPLVRPAVWIASLLACSALVLFAVNRGAGDVAIASTRRLFTDPWHPTCKVGRFLFANMKCVAGCGCPCGLQRCALRCC
jgi:hypothetical protein